MKSIELDYTKRCAGEPEKGHNRWHPDIPPALEVEPGEEVVLQTRKGHFVPRFKESFDVALSHHVDGFSGAADKDHLFYFVGIDESTDFFTGAFEKIGGLLAQGVYTAMNIRIAALVVIDQGLDHLAGLL